MTVKSGTICIPSAREWQKIICSVKEMAAQTAKGYLETEDSTGKKAESEEKTDRRQQEYDLIHEALERYRNAPAGSGIRDGLEYLIKKHRRVVSAVGGRLYRERHNALVLKYMISQPMTNVEIEKRLEISDNTFKRQIDRGIQELAVIFFGGACLDE